MRIGRKNRLLIGLVLVTSMLAVPSAQSLPGGIAGVQESGCNCHGAVPSDSVVGSIEGLPDSYNYSEVYNLTLSFEGGPSQPGNVNQGGFHLWASEGELSRRGTHEVTRVKLDEALRSRELQEQRRLLEQIRDEQEKQTRAMAEAKSEVTETKGKMEEMSDRVRELEVGNLYGGQVPSNTSAARNQGAIRSMLVVSGLQRIRPRSASPSSTIRRRPLSSGSTRNTAELRQQ